jgi:two-component system chemotaxis response regulator CheY
MKVLVVDDSKAMRMIVTRSLRQIGIADLVLEEAGTGMEAIKVVEGFTPDLILADWNMPGMTGYELFLELKAMGYNGQYGFITTEASEEMKAKAAEAGASCFVTKPFTPEILTKALDGMI